MRQTLIALVLWFLANGIGFAAPAPADFAGWWAVRTGERNVIVLHIEVGGDGRLQGDYWTPKAFVIDKDTIDQIKGVTVRQAVSHPRLEHGGVTFTVSKPDNPGDHDRMLLKLADAAHGQLIYDDFPSVSMDVVSVPAGSRVADDWRSDQSYTLDHQAPVEIQSNTEMSRLFDADQAVRTTTNFNKIDWSVVSKQDEERRAATARLLAAGSLHTADDFYHAAFIFQHGSKPDDFLLAHTLAMVAVKKGRRNAIWIASATLDRYLQKIGRPQVYGTQFLTAKNGTTQEPYDRALISDALRAELDVPPQAGQEAQRAEYERQLGKP